MADSSVATSTEVQLPAPAAEVQKPVFPERILHDERCPPGMTFVPGGRWTAAHRKRIASFRRTIPGSEMKFHDQIDDFCLDVSEITLGDVARCVAAGTCALPTPPDRPGASEEVKSIEELLDGSDLDRWKVKWDEVAGLPRTWVSPQDAMQLCAAMDRRLPTIEEWWWAAWGGPENRQYPWGSKRPSTRHLNICDYDCEHRDESADGFDGKAPVGGFPAGAGRWGHVDMAGNVEEWVQTRPPDSSTMEDDEVATMGRRYASVCGESHDTFYSDFMKRWPAFTCGATGDVREYSSSSAHVGFRCARAPVSLTQSTFDSSRG